MEELELRSLYGRQRVRMGRYFPDRGHYERMDMSDLGERQERIGAIFRFSDSLVVDPLGSVRVALDLEIILELLIPDRTPISEELFHLAQDKSIAL
jgi:hypothetical protein